MSAAAISLSGWVPAGGTAGVRGPKSAAGQEEVCSTEGVGGAGAEEEGRGRNTGGGRRKMRRRRKRMVRVP